MQLPKVKFSKPPIGLDDQVNLLSRRGLRIDDSVQARQDLKFIGYYRLSAYTRFFTKREAGVGDDLPSDACFSDAVALYNFDRKLRALLMDALERIEIAVKAALSLEGAMRKGAFWLCDPGNFDVSKHAEIMEGLRDSVGNDRKSQHPFISHFYGKYSDEMPPCWMIVETISFGQLSRIYQSMRGELQTAVAQHFKINRTILESWLHALTFGRNVCAHNGRVWNRVFTIKPKIPHQYERVWPYRSHDKVYVLCCLINHLMHVISDATAWPDSLRALMRERGPIPLAPMGFPQNWEKSPFWTFKTSD